MTDDEIRAAIAAIPDSARFFPPNTTEIAIYRAGMRRAARVARNTAGEFFAASNVERSTGADIPAAAIERAAGSGG